LLVFAQGRFVGVLKDHETGAKTADLSREHRAPEAAARSLKARCGGSDIGTAKRLVAPEDENGELKKLARKSGSRPVRFKSDYRKLVGFAHRARGRQNALRRRVATRRFA
jgi:putative transposase